MEQSLKKSLRTFAPCCLFNLGRKGVAITLVLSILHSFAVVPFAHASFWAERGAAAKNLRKEQNPDQAQVQTQPQAGLTPAPTLLAQLPSIQQQIYSNAITPAAGPDWKINSSARELGLSGSEFKIPASIASLPIHYANLKKASIPPSWKPSDPIVIHIQDVHLNREAQDNIGLSIQHLIDNGNVNLIALEGAFGNMDFSRFRAYKDQESVKKVMDYLLKDGKISGAVHAGLTGDKNIPKYEGVDNTTHYRAHVDAYRQSRELAAGYKESLAVYAVQIGKEKGVAFNPDLKEFDSKVTSFREEKLKLGDYVRFLSGRDAKISADVRQFLKALEMEKSLDFAKVEQDRAAIIEKLAKNLKKKQLAELVNVSLSYRLGKIRHSGFYLYLRDLCAKHGVEFGHYAAMNSYIQYILLSDAINADRLLNDIKMMEESGYQSLAKTPAEKNLTALSKCIYLTGKLLDYSLAPQEWDEYDRLSGPREILQSKIGRRGSFDLNHFENFFREAIERDNLMAANLMKSIEGQKNSVSVLVAGGFHSAGIEAKLRENHIAVITLAPKISKVDTKDGSTYLNVFAQEKTPLEKLFQGDKLFVAPEVFSPATELTAAVLIPLRSAAAHSSINIEQINAGFHELSATKGDGFNVSDEHISNGVLEATIDGPTRRERLDIEFDSNSDIVSIRYMPATGTYRAAKVFLEILYFFHKLDARVHRSSSLSYSEYVNLRFGLASVSDFKRWVQVSFAPTFELPLMFPLSFLPEKAALTAAKWHKDHPEMFLQRVQSFKLIKQETLSAIREKVGIKLVKGLTSWMTFFSVYTIVQSFVNPAGPEPPGWAMVAVSAFALISLPFVLAAISAHRVTHRIINWMLPQAALTLGDFPEYNKNNVRRETLQSLDNLLQDKKANRVQIEGILAGIERDGKPAFSKANIKKLMLVGADKFRSKLILLPYLMELKRDEKFVLNGSHIAVIVYSQKTTDESRQLIDALLEKKDKSDQWLLNGSQISQIVLSGKSKNEALELIDALLEKKDKSGQWLLNGSQISQIVKSKMTLHQINALINEIDNNFHDVIRKYGSDNAGQLKFYEDLFGSGAPGLPLDLLWHVLPKQLKEKVRWNQINISLTDAKILTQITLDEDGLKAGAHYFPMEGYRGYEGLPKFFDALRRAGVVRSRRAALDYLTTIPRDVREAQAWYWSPLLISLQRPFGGEGELSMEGVIADPNQDPAAAAEENILLDQIKAILGAGDYETFLALVDRPRSELTADENRMLSGLMEKARKGLGIELAKDDGFEGDEEEGEHGGDGLNSGGAWHVGDAAEILARAFSGMTQTLLSMMTAGLSDEIRIEIKSIIMAAKDGDPDQRAALRDSFKKLSHDQQMALLYDVASRSNSWFNYDWQDSIADSLREQYPHSSVRVIRSENYSMVVGLRWPGHEELTLHLSVSDQDELFSDPLNHSLAQYRAPPGKNKNYDYSVILQEKIFYLGDEVLGIILKHEIEEITRMRDSDGKIGAEEAHRAALETVGGVEAVQLVQDGLARLLEESSPLLQEYPTPFSELFWFYAHEDRDFGRQGPFILKSAQDVTGLLPMPPVNTWIVILNDDDYPGSLKI